MTTFSGILGGRDVSLALDATLSITISQAGTQRVNLTNANSSHTFQIGSVAMSNLVVDRLRDGRQSEFTLSGVGLWLHTTPNVNYRVRYIVTDSEDNVLRTTSSRTIPHGDTELLENTGRIDDFVIPLTGLSIPGSSFNLFVNMERTADDPVQTDLDANFDNVVVLYNTGASGEVAVDVAARAAAEEAKIKAQEAVDNTLGTGTAQNQLISKRYNLTINSGNAVSAVHNFVRETDGSKLTHTLTILNEAVGNIPDIVGQDNNGGTFRADYHGAFTLELLPGYSDTDGDAIVELDVKVTRQVWQDSVHVPAFDRVVRISNARRNTGAFIPLYEFSAILPIACSSGALPAANVVRSTIANEIRLFIEIIPHDDEIFNSAVPLAHTIVQNDDSVFLTETQEARVVTGERGEAGTPGTAGAPGATGAQGPAGESVPENRQVPLGGLPEQVLTRLPAGGAGWQSISLLEQKVVFLTTIEVAPSGQDQAAVDFDATATTQIQGQGLTQSSFTKISFNIEESLRGLARSGSTINISLSFLVRRRTGGFPNFAGNNVSARLLDTDGSSVLLGYTANESVGTSDTTVTLAGNLPSTTAAAAGNAFLEVRWHANSNTNIDIVHSGYSGTVKLTAFGATGQQADTTPLAQGQWIERQVTNANNILIRRKRAYYDVNSGASGEFLENAGEPVPLGVGAIPLEVFGDVLPDTSLSNFSHATGQIEYTVNDAIINFNLVTPSFTLEGNPRFTVKTGENTAYSNPPTPSTTGIHNGVGAAVDTTQNVEFDFVILRVRNGVVTEIQRSLVELLASQNLSGEMSFSREVDLIQGDGLYWALDASDYDSSTPAAPLPSEIIVDFITPITVRNYASDAIRHSLFVDQLTYRGEGPGFIPNPNPRVVLALPQDIDVTGVSLIAIQYRVLGDEGWLIIPFHGFVMTGDPTRGFLTNHSFGPVAWGIILQDGETRILYYKGQGNDPDTGIPFTRMSWLLDNSPGMNHVFALLIGFGTQTNNFWEILQIWAMGGPGGTA